jgi:hypothetical protein
VHLRGRARAVQARRASRRRTSPSTTTSS